MVWVKETATEPREMLVRVLPSVWIAARGETLTNCSQAARHASPARGECSWCAAGRICRAGWRLSSGGEDWSLARPEVGAAEAGHGSAAVRRAQQHASTQTPWPLPHRFARALWLLVQAQQPHGDRDDAAHGKL